MSNNRSFISLSIIALVVVGYGIYARMHVPMQSKDVSTPTQNTATPHISPPSPAVIAQLAKSHGFQAFVSATDGGFEPGTVAIKQGETIRFTNNTTHDIWIAQITDKNTPASPNLQSCDVPFNSCRALKPGDFVEFTFAARGTYQYMDNLQTTTVGMVVVE